MKCLGDGTSVHIVTSIKRSIFLSAKHLKASNPIFKRLSRRSALSVSIALSMLLAAIVLAPSAPRMLTGGGSVTAFDETIGTFAADFSTPKSDWNLGQTANAKTTGSPNDRRVEWVAPDGTVAQVSGFYSSGTLSDSYAIQTGSDPLAQVGTWTVQTIDPSGNAFVAAQFVVHGPTANADLAIAKFAPTSQISAGSNISYRIEVTNHGPDDAQSVTLTDPTPANTTFVSLAQNSGPAFTTPPSGNGPCTIATLPVNAIAIFSFTFTVNAGTADGTDITNVANISSSPPPNGTNDPRPLDNTASTSNTVVAASTVCSLTCPGDVSATASGCTAVVTYSTPTTSGNCGTDPVECSPPSGSTFPIGTTTVNCSAAGDEGVCSFNVIVSGSDTTAPTITCPSNIETPEDPAGSGTANVSYATPAATDNCTQGVQVSCSPPPGSTFPTGATTVTCTATDASTNSASCTFTVTVAANNCTLTCPPNVTESTSSGCSKVVTYAAPSESGSCGTVSCDPASGSVFPVGSTQVICAARDTSGNLLATCNFTVTVNDTGTLTCPANITTPENPQGSGSATVNYQEPTACSGPPVTCTPASGSSFPVGTTTVTCHNTGSCTFTVTVTTGTCTINCPANKTVSNDSNQCGAVVTFGDPTISGSCGGSDPGQPFCDPPSGSFFPVGATTVTCGFSNINFAQCTFTVTVNDTQAPVIVCPANITKNNDPGQCSAVATYTTPTATDNCPGVGAVSCSPASGSTFAKGTTTVTCSATDAHGNTGSCQFTVTVNDTENPTISCPANITQANDTGLCSAVVSFSATASDNCPGATANCSPASGSTFPKGTTTVTCSATDTSGNTSATTCSFTVTVNDTENPTISCPANKVQSTDPNVCSAVVNFSATANDNCPGVTYSCSPPSGSTFPKGTTTVTCTATDTSSHTASCQFTVTVNDTQPPAITCPANIVKEPTCPAGAKATFAPVVSDNCPGVGFVCSPATDSTFPIGTTTVTCTATDTSGNSTACSFTVRVKTSAEVVQDLIARVQALAPPLTGQQSQGLVSKLQAALNAINSGQTNVACNKLADFINQVGVYINNGTLTSTQGQPLIDSAANVRNALGCTSLPCS